MRKLIVLVLTAIGVLSATAQAADVEAGKVFFTTKRMGTSFESCATCHTHNPTAEGKHAITGKTIKPMAVSANPARFTDSAKTEKWFKRNCVEVIGRECSTTEKENITAWLKQ